MRRAERLGSALTYFTTSLRSLPTTQPVLLNASQVTQAAQSADAADQGQGRSGTQKPPNFSYSSFEAKTTLACPTDANLG
jgi:hypothetical protein